MQIDQKRKTAPLTLHRERFNQEFKELVIDNKDTLVAHHDERNPDKSQ